MSIHVWLELKHFLLGIFFFIKCIVICSHHFFFGGGGVECYKLLKYRIEFV